jgi:hypothetical protein
LGAERHRLAIGEFAAHRDDTGNRQVVLRADEFRDRRGIAVADVDIQKNDMRAESFALESGFEAVDRDPDLVPGLFDQNALQGLMFDMDPRRPLTGSAAAPQPGQAGDTQND